MNRELLIDIVDDLNLPVVLCDNAPGWPVRYMNKKMAMLSTPTYSVDRLKGREKKSVLADMLNFTTASELSSFSMLLEKTGHADDYRIELKTHDDKLIPVTLSGKLTNDGKEALFFLNENISGGADSHEKWLYTIINTAMLSEDVEQSIDMILDLAGRQIKASRVYIFEEVSATTTRNTYEWCAPGVQPAIQDLQQLDKEDYNYDTIIASGMYITDDVRELPDGDREILEMQNIRSLAILTIYYGGMPLGYVGFDDTVNYRKWSSDDIRFLNTVASLLSVMIKRRDTEQSFMRSIEILQFMSDNSDEVIYVNDIDDYTVKFVSKALLDSIGSTQEEVMGKKCWQVFQKDMTGPCDFCPIPKIKTDANGVGTSVYAWEKRNTLNNKIYMIKDNIVRWVDGKLVHMETAIDITSMKEYEDKLRYLASTDVMTGIYNREWGTVELEKKLEEGGGGTLCFIDVDGLKHTNDTCGHNAGDQLLKETVKMIGDCVTREEHIFCRWGGDEFLLWINVPSNTADELMKTVINDMDKINGERKGKSDIFLSFSYGIVPFEKTRGSLDEIVTVADALMYEHKMAKRGRVKKRRRSD